jgi:(2Fe-2S) ferredoxin
MVCHYESGVWYAIISESGVWYAIMKVVYGESGLRHTSTH